MTVNKWQKPLILNNCNMNIIEIKNNFSLEKVEKSADIVIVDSVKVDPNDFQINILKILHLKFVT